jgi:hypothetical protein
MALPPPLFQPLMYEGGRGRSQGVGRSIGPFDISSLKGNRLLLIITRRSTVLRQEAQVMLALLLAARNHPRPCNAPEACTC